MTDVERSTAGSARRLGYILPQDWPDDLEVTFSRKLTADGVLHLSVCAGRPLPDMPCGIRTMSVQCSWCSYHGSDRRRAALWCIRDDGHEGEHRAYNGRWNPDAQFKRDGASQSNGPATEGSNG